MIEFMNYFNKTMICNAQNMKTINNATRIKPQNLHLFKQTHANHKHLLNLINLCNEQRMRARTRAHVRVQTHHNNKKHNKTAKQKKNNNNKK